MLFPQSSYSSSSSGGGWDIEDLIFLGGDVSVNIYYKLIVSLNNKKYTLGLVLLYMSCLVTLLFNNEMMIQLAINEKILCIITIWFLSVSCSTHIKMCVGGNLQFKPATF